MLFHINLLSIESLWTLLELESSGFFDESQKELDNSDTMNDRHQIQPYPIRMAPEMREKLEAAAKAGNRSLHAEIMQRLEISFQNAQEKSAVNEAINLCAAFDQLIDNPELFELFKKRRKAIELMRKLSSFINEHKALFDEEANADPNADMETIVERMKKRLAKK